MSSVVERSTVAVEGFSRSQKAAAVLLAVGPEAAAKVMKHLSEWEVEAVATEVARLREVPREWLLQILEEFYAEAQGRSHLVAGGEEHARRLLRKLMGDRADEVIDRLLASSGEAPFHFLLQHEAVEVIQHLRDEHPQTIALILAHLPTKLAAQILAGLDADVQTEVAWRVATIDRISPEVVKRVEDALRERFGTVAHRSSHDRGGVRELAALLNHTDRGTEKAILADLESNAPELAEQVRALMFVFEDIVSLDDRAIQEILRQVEGKRLAIALKGVGDQVRETVERNLSERARETLTEETELLGPVRVRDVEEAQGEIVARIRALEEEGTIIVNRGAEGEFIE